MPAGITVLDLFTGAGGLTQGWHEAAANLGIASTTVGSVESDPVAAATYRANFVSKGQYVGRIEDWLEQIDTLNADVILGGPPCQGFSKLGKRDINDERNFLWLKYAETISRAQPSYFVLENVVPFLKSEQFDALSKEAQPGGLLEGYKLEPFKLRAIQYGSRQNRIRAVVIGRLSNLPPVETPPATVEDGKWLTVRDAFEGVPDKVNGRQLPPRLGEGGFAGPYESWELHVERNYTQKSLLRFNSIPKGGNRFDLPYDLQAPCWRNAPTGYTDVMGRLHLDRPSVTIRTEFEKPEKGRYLHPTKNRAITPFEAARLQGFPDSFKWRGPKASIAKQIGNAVPVELARAISEHVLRQFMHYQ